MGGIFGKDKRLCVLPPRVTFHKGKGRKAVSSAPRLCDAATWTGENHFQSARIGRTPKGPDPAAVKMVLATPGSPSAAQAAQETGEQAPSLRAQAAGTPRSAAARDAREVEVPQEPEAKPGTEVVQYQELSEQEKQEAHPARRSPRGMSETEAVLHPAGSCSKQLGCEDDGEEPLARTTVRAEVHVPAGVQGAAGGFETATAEPELLSGAEQEAGAVGDSEEPCAGETQQEAAAQEAADSSAASCPTEEPDLPLKPAETREEGEEGGCCAAEASADPQLEGDTKLPAAEDTEGKASEPEPAAGCGDRQASKAIAGCLVPTQAALQDEQEIEAGNGGTAGEL